MSFPRHGGYRDSGVAWLGEVPAHWQARRLKTLSPAITVGIVVNPSDYVSVAGLPFIYGGDISEGRISTDSCRRIDPVDSTKQPKTRLNSGDLLTVRVGAPGVTAVVPDECEGGNCASVMLIRRGNFDSSWLCYAMNSRIVRYQVEVVQYGAAQEQFNISHAINFWVATPPRAEQSAIAAFLDRETGKIDALIAEQEKLLTLLAEKRQATISHAVTRGLNPNVPMKDSGVPWLGEVPAHWKVTRLKFVAVVQTGIAKGKNTQGKEVITVPYLRVANVQDGHLALDEVAMIDIEPEQLDRYRLQAGDVLMNEGGDFDKLGRGAIWNAEIEACIHQNHVFAVRPHAVSPQWLNQITGSQYAQFYFMGRSKQSTNLASISSTNIMELPILLPPVDEQASILAFVDNESARLDALYASSVQAIALLKERRSALIAAAVTGKIDVRQAA